MPTKTSYLPIIRLIFISLFFSFNFIDREISNVFLIATLLFCVIDYRDLVNKIRENKKIIYPIVLFFMDSNGSILSQESIHELDNYTRLLLSSLF